MCGIAGYSLKADSDLDRTFSAQALLAGIAERGADAVGYASRSSGSVAVHKQRSGASALLDRVSIADDATQVLVHVRDYTKGHPTIEANNHPVRHGSVVGIHNGIITNDEEIFARHRFVHSEPEMTVDSAAIFALAERADSRAQALEELRGSLAAAWMDERRADVLFLARGVGRPLWIGRAESALLFASTEATLKLAERYCALELEREEIEEGTLLALAHGREVWRERFQPDHSHEETPLPAVRAPREGASCLNRLAAIAAAI
jgi:glucosamine 6-phosphate synthetase-like amidotransferase/phosphosugar isomerase protein